MKSTHATSTRLSVALVAMLLTAADRSKAEPAVKFEPKQLQEDFRIARQSLEEGHPGLYRHIDKVELDRVFDQAAKSLNRPMDFYEFYRLVAPAIAAIKCGHTGVGISTAIQEETDRLAWLPFDVKVLGGKAYIFRDYVQGGKLAGKEIKSINGAPASRILATMLAASMKDGDTQTTRQMDISGNFGLNLIALLGIKAPYDVALAGSGGKQAESVRVAGVRPDERAKLSKQLYPQDQAGKEFGALKFLDDGKIACLTYSSFGTAMEEAEAFMKRSFADIEAKRSKTLILDVRGNGGGEDALGKLLFSYLVDAPFMYYDDLIANKMNFTFAKYTEPHRDLIPPDDVAERRADGKFHLIKYDNMGLQQPSKPTFTGPVYILIDGGCLSTTAEFLTAAHSRHRATFIGEESAGCYYGPTSGDIVRIMLPNTKMLIYIPIVSYYLSVEGGHQHDAGRGVIPDFPVERTITDMVAGTDRDLELALELSRKGR